MRHPPSRIPARSARLHTIGRRRRRQAASAVRAVGLYGRRWRTIDCWSTAIGAFWTVRPVGSVWPIRTIWSARPVWPVRPVRPIRPVGAIRPIRPVGAPWPVRSIGAPRPVRAPRPVGPVVTVAPVVITPRAVAVIVRVDACTQRRGAKEERQRGCEPGHDCGRFLAVGHLRDGSACSGLRLHYVLCERGFCMTPSATNLVREIVSRHGGHVSVADAPGGGACFSAALRTAVNSKPGNVIPLRRGQVKAAL